MSRKTWYLLSFLTLLLCAAPGCNQPRGEAQAQEQAKKPPTIMLIDREDPEMQAAIRKARREVDDLLISLHQPKPQQQDFAVKVAFSDKDQIEHMWLVDLKFEQGLILGTLANDPQTITGYEKGGVYAVAPEEVTDWYYFEGEKMVGGYTVELLVARGVY